MVIEQIWAYPVSLSLPFIDRINPYLLVSYSTDGPDDALHDSNVIKHTACEAGGGRGFW